MSTNLVRGLAAVMGLASVFGVEAASPAKTGVHVGPGGVIVQQSAIGGRLIIRGSAPSSVTIDPASRIDGGVYHIDQHGRTTIITPRPSPLGETENEAEIPPHCAKIFNGTTVPRATLMPPRAQFSPTYRRCPVGTYDTTQPKTDELSSDVTDVVPSLSNDRVVAPVSETRGFPFAVFKTNVRDIFCNVSGDMIVGNLNSSCQTYPNGTFEVPNPYPHNVGFTDKTVIYCKDQNQIDAATRSYLQSREIPTSIQDKKACVVFKFG